MLFVFNNIYVTYLRTYYYTIIIELSRLRGRVLEELSSIFRVITMLNSIG